MQITVLNKKEKVAGVVTRVVEELEWVDTNLDGLIQEDEDLIEVSRNYFAKTEEGTVCYFGEDVDIYEDGEIVSHEGAWRADEDDNASGIFMPADLKPGDEFPQEVASGIAEDRAKIIGSGPDEVPAGSFAETLRLREFNPLEGDKDCKVYARDVGIIRDATLELKSY